MEAAARGCSKALWPAISIVVQPERVCHQLRQTGSVDAEAVEQARTITLDSCRDDVSVSNASEVELTEWLIQDEPVMYITVCDLRRDCFSREEFAELNAKLRGRRIRRGYTCSTSNLNSTLVNLS